MLRYDIMRILPHPLRASSQGSLQHEVRLKVEGVVRVRNALAVETLSNGSVGLVFGVDNVNVTLLA